MSEPDFNVVKIGRGSASISLLLYPEFFNEAFPRLAKSTSIDISNESVRVRRYDPDGNPPILHKKELLLDLAHPRRRKFELFSEQLEIRNIKPNKPGLGFKKQWEAYLVIMRVDVQNHQLKDL